MDYADVMSLSPEMFPSSFRTWVLRNPDIVDTFFQQADHIRARGFDHYSARTILHWMRHHTALTEGNGSVFKINDHASPYLARLYLLARPQAPEKFFALRVIASQPCEVWGEAA